MNRKRARDALEPEHRPPGHAAPIVIEVPESRRKSKIDRFNEKIHPAIMKVPFFTMIVGPRGSGKTNLIINFLKTFYKKAFKEKNVVVYKPTKNLDDSFDLLNLKHYYGIDTHLPTILTSIEKQQLAFVKADNLDQVLLVLDDITQIPDAWDILERLGYIGRHFGVQIIAVCHKISSAPRGVRTQCQQWILFEPNEQSELDWILQTFASKNTKNVWEVALDRAWSIPYNFVYIDFERDKEDIYHSGFNEPLFTPMELSLMKPDLESFLSNRQLERMHHFSEPLLLPDETVNTQDQDNVEHQSKRRRKTQ